MGDTVATTENGYERIKIIADAMIQTVVYLDDFADNFDDVDMALILTALCADGTAFVARLAVFARQFKEQLECISIDQ